MIDFQAPHIDKTDFLNTVVREKKRFENALDDSVAAGLNAGTEVLMNQVRIISASFISITRLICMLLTIVIIIPSRSNISYLRLQNHGSTIPRKMLL